MNIEKIAPLERYAAVTPKPAALAFGKTRAISVNAAGTVVIVNHAGADVTVYMAAGVLYPIVTGTIKAGGTATGITAWW